MEAGSKSFFRYLPVSERDRQFGMYITTTGIGISLGTIVGLVTVFGISARNSILQLAHYEHLVEIEHLPWNLDTVLRGANERLIPILMTATVTALGLVPLAFGSNHPGQEIEGPMAITVLGGVEPLLQASPQGQASILTPWSLNSGAADAGTQ